MWPRLPYDRLLGNSYIVYIGGQVGMLVDKESNILYFQNQHSQTRFYATALMIHINMSEAPISKWSSVRFWDEPVSISHDWWILLFFWSHEALLIEVWLVPILSWKCLHKNDSISKCNYDSAAADKQAMTIQKQTNVPYNIVCLDICQTPGNTVPGNVLSGGGAEGVL